MNSHNNANVHRRGKAVVRALPPVHVVIRVNHVLAQFLVGDLGDHLIHVHVGLRAAARLENDQRKVVLDKVLVHSRVVQHLGREDDRSNLFCIQPLLAAIDQLVRVTI